jgi:hypothetical protein
VRNIRWFSIACLLPIAVFSCRAAFAVFPHTYTVGPNALTCDFTTIQAAVQASTTSGDTIVLAYGATYTEHVDIADRSLTIKSGASCLLGGATRLAPAESAPSVSVSGPGNDNVFAITGNSHITLIDLDIVNGKKSPGNGGAISFDGTGTLTLNTCWVRNNSADSGGGIWFKGTSTTTQSELKLQVDTRILVNIANSGGGGGIHVQGNSLLTVSGPRAEINGNKALNGNGGGIEVIGPAKANISSSDFAESSVVQGNSAKYGGGIAIEGDETDSGGSSVVQLFTQDASHPVGVVGNSASHTGGGIYLQPVDALGFTNYVSVFAWDYRVDDNFAAEGAAIYGDSDFDGIQYHTGSDVYLGGTVSFPLPTQLGAIACTDSRVCNTINGNHAEDAVGNPTSAILMQDDGYFNATRFSMRNNEVAHVIRIVGDDTFSELSECLIADNKGIDVAPPSGTQELIYAAGNSVGMMISSCTFANDLIGATHMIHTESDLTLENSIIAEPGTLALDYSGNPANRHILYVLSNDITTLPNSGNGVIPGTPVFVDPANGDYHLKATSLGVDFAPPPPIAPPGPDTIDLDGNPRDVDLAFAGDVFGTRDLGAYELQNGFRECGAQDSVFCDGFDH